MYKRRESWWGKQINEICYKIFHWKNHRFNKFKQQPERTINNSVFSSNYAWNLSFSLKNITLEIKKKFIHVIMIYELFIMITKYQNERYDSLINDVTIKFFSVKISTVSSINLFKGIFYTTCQTVALTKSLREWFIPSWCISENLLLKDNYYTEIYIHFLTCRFLSVCFP